VVSFRPWSLQPPGKYLQYPLSKELVSPKIGLDAMVKRKISFSGWASYHEPSVYHTLAYHYTDYAILAPTL
jgi:hypothetical protein